MMLSFSNIGRTLIIFGLIFIIIGGLLFVIDRLELRNRKIPGDIQFEWGPFSCVFALGTSIILSLLLTIVFNIIVRLLNR